MNGFLAAVTSSSPQIPPPDFSSETSYLSLHTTRPEFSSFKFKNIGQPPTLLSRFSDAGAISDYRSPSPERNDMDITSSEDPMMMVTDDHRTLQSAPRKSLLDMLGGSADQSHNQKSTIAHAQEPGVLEPIITSPPSAFTSKLVLPRPESRLSSVPRQLSAAADVPRADPTSSRASVAPETHTYEPPNSDTIDLYADPDSPSQSPLSLFSDLSEVVRESAELDRITSLHRLLTTEREELLARHEETARALLRTKTQLDRVLSLTDEAIQMTTVFVDKEKVRLETKKTKAEAKIERRKNLEAEQRRKVRELERIRQHEERKAQVEMEQRAERQRLEEQRGKEEALAAERQRQEEIQVRERAQAEERHRLEEERRRIEEEERRRLAEEDQGRRNEEERKRQAEEQRKEEERLCRKLAEKETAARKQEEDRRTRLLERRRLDQEGMKRKEAETAAARVEAEKQAVEKEQQRIFQERRATVLKDKYKNYNRPEPGAPPTGSSSILEGASNSNLSSVIVNDAPTNLQVVAEQHPGLAKIHRTCDTPTFVPATTEAGRFPPDLSQQVKVLDSLVDHPVKHETTSPVITPVDNARSVEGTPPTSLPSRPVSSTSTSTATLAPAPLPPPPHLPAKPVTIYSQPPVPLSLQQRGRSPRRYPPRRSHSRSRSSSRSRRGSPTLRVPSRTSRSPESVRGRYQSPPGRRSDHYSPPRQPYRDGGSRYDRDSRSDSPPPNPRKRTLQDTWVSANAPSKLDYLHPAKRRAASPLRSRSPPSPQPRPLTHPPPVVISRRPPPSSKRARGGGPSTHVPLEQRISRPPDLSERIR
ncbi:hypothetical protein BDM02DRAFT_843423 [Thelephora ganbajun]|uniref:Uncharacterized protein n=1 Tax=Thelephora ganbajun TaxID=370292 RepID=A0ACB6Z4W7_THEGA|nr:hypothetical protein BDM02DRAFT_843423 [Thelephora ganbajun]